MKLLNEYVAGMIVRKNLIALKYYRQNVEVQKTMLQVTLTALNKHFNTNVDMRFTLNSTMDGSCLAGGNHIVMCTMSIMTFVHEFRHALQHAGATTLSTDIELDAQIWSHTVFFIASPAMYITARDDNKFCHVAQFVAPLCKNGSMPGDTKLMQRFYKHFDKFCKALRNEEVQTFSVDDLMLATNSHAKMREHVSTVALA